MLVYRRAFAVAPSLRLATGGRSIVSPLRYSTVADAAATPPVTPAEPAESSSAPSYTSKSKSTRLYRPYEPKSSSFASRNGPFPPSASSPSPTKGPTTKPTPKINPLASTLVNEALQSSAPSEAPVSEPGTKTPESLHWRPTAPPARETPSDGYPVDIDWTTSYHGLGTSPVTPAQFAILSKSISATDIEVKPDGILYLPEIKYRRKLNEAFGPMGWGIAPRGEVVVGKDIVTREYALIINGCFVSQAQGVNNYFSAESIPQAVEGAKSNALMRCCKDIGIASELWDPGFIHWFTKRHVTSSWVEHTINKKKKKWYHKKSHPVELPYPYKIATNTK